MNHPYKPPPGNGFLRWGYLGGPAIVYAALIYFLSSLSHIGDEISAFSSLDKAAHFLEYLFFGLLLCRWISGGAPERRKNRSLVMAVTVGTVYGLLDEWHQSFVPGRDASLWDALFDGLGAAAGAAIYGWLGRRVSPAPERKEHS